MSLARPNNLPSISPENKINPDSAIFFSIAFYCVNVIISPIYTDII